MKTFLACLVVLVCLCAAALAGNSSAYPAEIGCAGAADCAGAASCSGLAYRGPVRRLIHRAPVRRALRGIVHRGCCR